MLKRRQDLVPGSNVPDLCSRIAAGRKDSAVGTEGYLVDAVPVLHDRPANLTGANFPDSKSAVPTVSGDLSSIRSKATHSIARSCCIGPEIGEPVRASHTRAVLSSQRVTARTAIGGKHYLSDAVLVRQRGRNRLSCCGIPNPCGRIPTGCSYQMPIPTENRRPHRARITGVFLEKNPPAYPTGTRYWQQMQLLGYRRD